MTTEIRALKIGTRSSALALAQAHMVQAELAAIGVQSELVTYTTVGDRRLDVALTAIGSKGLFTEELERDLLRKDRALAETAALLVLSKKVEAIFRRGEDE